jgi:hypothetical protein
MNDYNIDQEVLDEIKRIYKNSYNSCTSYTYNSSADYVAINALIALVEAEVAEIIMLKDDRVRDYWTKLVQSVTKSIRDRKVRHRTYELSMEAYNILAAEERKILRIRKPTKPRDYVDQSTG